MIEDNHDIAAALAQRDGSMPGFVGVCCVRWVKCGEGKKMSVWLVGTCVELVVVSLELLGTCFKWPFRDVAESVRCFCTSSVVRLGHKEEWPAWIALIHVLDIGLKHH